MWQCIHKRKIRDNITLNKQIERAEQIAAGTCPAKSDLGSSPRHQARRELGKSREGPRIHRPQGVRHQPQHRDGFAAEIVAVYHDLFQVEATFRMAKTDLRARPMFASTADSIHAHLTVVLRSRSAGTLQDHRRDGPPYRPRAAPAA
ncbi:MAG: hypothetical protein R2723_11415 [Microbacterium sp.]